MIDTSMPRASSEWHTTCPKRPKPITSTLPSSPSAFSTPSKDSSALGSTHFRPSRVMGVSAIDTMTIAVKVALLPAVMMPALAAAAYSTKANSPPCANSTAR